MWELVLAMEMALTPVERVNAWHQSRHIARSYGERLNGGVEVYRTEPAMHRAIGEFHVKDEGGTWLVSFLGGAVEEVALSGRYRILTEVRIDKKSYQATVAYNGPIMPERLSQRPDVRLFQDSQGYYAVLVVKPQHKVNQERP